MVKIENETQYKEVLKRVEDLMLTLSENTSKYDRAIVGLELLGNLAAPKGESSGTIRSSWDTTYPH